MLTVLRSWVTNPILEKEILSRMRSWRAPVLISVFIALLSLVAFGALSVIAAQQNGPFAGTVTAGAGLGVFGAMVVTELLLLLFMAPALTAGSISGERERQTLDLLLCTRVRPGAIVVGKLLSSLIFIVLLLLISVPLFSLVFLFGGIELDQVLAVIVIGIITAVVIGSIGLFFSAMMRTTVGSMVLTYVATFVFLILPATLPGFFVALTPSFSSVPGVSTFTRGQSIVGMVDPFIALGSTLTPPGTITNNNVPLAVGGIGSSGGMICSTTPTGRSCRSTGGSFNVIPGRGIGTPAQGVLPAGNVVMSGDQVAEGPLTGWHAWQMFTLFDVGIAAVLLFCATLLLRRRAPWVRPRPAPPPPPVPRG